MRDWIEEELELLTAVVDRPSELEEDKMAGPIADLELKPPLCVSESSCIQQALDAMREHRTGSVLVTAGGLLVGIFTERDLMMKVVGLVNDLRGTPVSQVMTADPVCLQRHDAIIYVMNNMHIGHFRHIPIVDDLGRPEGVVSIRDLMDFLLADQRALVANVTCEPFRGQPTRESA